MKNADRFMTKYHVAMARANKDRLDNLKPKIASDWVNQWMEDIGGKITDEEEFRAKFEEFLSKDLGFADNIKVSLEGDMLAIDVGGCMLCPGNDALRKAGEIPLCLIAPTGLLAISRVMGKKATLLGVDKEGKPVGFCHIVYKLEEK